jgi:hypothetical protein
MATTYRERLIAEINSCPDSIMPELYKWVHKLKNEVSVIAKEQILPTSKIKSQVKWDSDPILGIVGMCESNSGDGSLNHDRCLYGAHRR